jgi:hypothetical protein
MTMHLRKLILPLSVALSVGVAAPALAKKHPRPPVLIPAPPPGKGQVVFFRPANRVMGRFIGLPVRDGDAGIGTLGNGSYVVHVVEPGPHVFTTRLKVTDRLPLEVEAGETYYVEQTMGVGLVAGHPRLTPAERADFEALKLKPSTRKAKDLKRKRER